MSFVILTFVKIKICLWLIWHDECVWLWGKAKIGLDGNLLGMGNSLSNLYNPKCPFLALTGHSDICENQSLALAHLAQCHCYKI